MCSQLTESGVIPGTQLQAKQIALVVAQYCIYSEYPVQLGVMVSFCCNQDENMQLLATFLHHLTWCKKQSDQSKPQQSNL